MNFADWFKEQHGPRPSDRNIGDLVREAVTLEARASEARRLVEDTRTWDLRWTSAHYAWQLSDEDKAQ